MFVRIWTFLLTASTCYAMPSTFVSPLLSFLSTMSRGTFMVLDCLDWLVEIQFFYLMIVIIKKMERLLG